MKKTLTIALLLALLATCLPMGMAAAQENVDITMWTFLDLNSANGRAIVLGQLIDAFEKDHPGVTITVKTQEWSTLSAKVIAATAAGNAPDLFMVNSENLGATLKAGCFEPLENLFCADWTDADYADVASAMWDAGYDGKYHYQVPCFYTVYGVYYRKDLLADKGIDVARLKTWDDLLEAAKQLTYVDENGVQVYGLGTGYATDVTDPQGYLPAMLASQEGGLFTPEGWPNNWTSDCAVAALQRQLDLINVYGVDSPSACSISQEEIYNLFEAGSYAMIFGGSVRVPTVKSLSAFDPEYVGFMGNRAVTPDGEPCTSAVAGWHIGVSAKSANKEVAGQFLSSLMSPEADMKWVTEANQLPLRISTLQQHAEIFQQNDWMAVAADIVANHAYTHSTQFTVAGFSEDLQNAMIRSYVDGIAPADALAEAEQAFINRNLGR